MGFKRTEIGVLPEDWEVVALIDACGFAAGKAHEPYVSEFGLYVVVNSKFISTEGDVVKRCSQNLTPAKAGDIMIVMSDLPNGRALAKTFVADQDEKYAVNQRIARLRPRKAISGFVAAYLDRNNYFLKFDDGVNQTHLLNPVFKACLLPLPPLPEQEAIAGALSDADGAVRAVERLIEKKRAVKQAALHALLTPTTRLPGFSEDWETKTLGECCARIFGGGTPSRSAEAFWNGRIPWATIKDITSHNPERTQETISEQGLEQSASKLVAAGTLIIGTRMAVGVPALFSVAVAINQDLKALELTGDNHSKYFFYWFCYKRNELESRSSGSTVSGLSTNDLRAIEISLPPLPEQRAIAAVLSDMDAAIAALEARRDKLKAVKQGIMQALLTGKVRLV